MQKKNFGGGVAIDLIHEWDYVSYIFGLPIEVKKIYKKVSNLEINVEDVAIYIAEYKNMLAEIHLDYFGRERIRQIEIFTEEDTIVGDLVNSKVNYLKENKLIEFGEERNEFQRKELEYFFETVINNEYEKSNIKNAKEVLKIIK